MNKPIYSKEDIECVECGYTYECKPDDPDDLCECPECRKEQDKKELFLKYEELRQAGVLTEFTNNYDEYFRKYL